MSPASGGRRLILTTNGAIDYVLLVDGGLVVSAWPVVPELVREFVESVHVGDWDVQHAEGLETDEGDRLTVEDYGDVVAVRAEEGTVEVAEPVRWAYLTTSPESR